MKKYILLSVSLIVVIWFSSGFFYDQIHSFLHPRHFANTKIDANAAIRNENDLKLYNETDPILFISKDLGYQTLDSQAKLLKPYIEKKTNLFFNSQNFTIDELSEEDFTKQIYTILNSRNDSYHNSLEEAVYRSLNKFSKRWNIINSLSMCYARNIPCFVDYPNRKILILKTDDALFRHILLIKSLFIYIMEANAKDKNTELSVNLTNISNVFNEAISNVLTSSYLSQIELIVKIVKPDISKRIQNQVSYEDSAFGAIYLNKIRLLEDVITNQIQSEHETIRTLLAKFTTNRFEIDDFNSFYDENQSESIYRLPSWPKNKFEEFEFLPNLGNMYWQIGEPVDEKIIFDKKTNILAVSFTFEPQWLQSTDKQIENAKHILHTKKIFDTIVTTENQLIGFNKMDGAVELDLVNYTKKLDKLENYVGQDTLFFKQGDIKLSDGEIESMKLDAETADAFTFSSDRYLASNGVEMKIAKSFYGPDTKANAIREVLYSFTKTFVESRGRFMVWTSGHRTDSKNHENGALDYSSNGNLTSEERHTEARELSKALYEAGYTNTIVIAEELLLPTSGTSNGYHLLIAGPTVVQSSYINGQCVSVRFNPQKSGDNVTHTHVGIQNTSTVEATFSSWKLKQEIEGSNERIEWLSTPAIGPILGSMAKTLNMEFKPITEQQIAAILIRAIAYGHALDNAIQNGTYTSGTTYGFGNGMADGTAMGPRGNPGTLSSGGGLSGDPGACNATICIDFSSDMNFGSH